MSKDSLRESLKEPRLAQLLMHPAIWRGRSSAAIPCFSSGFQLLDTGLPGGGWPQTGLVEILTPYHGLGELRLLMPMLAQASHAEPARWITWIAPPFEPYAPALVAHGLALARQLIVRTETALWAMEQALGGGACTVALTWVRRASPRSIRRLQIASERGQTLGFVFRALSSARESSAAQLRLILNPRPGGLRVTLHKSRGGTRAPIDIDWPSGHG
ncbi:MAG: translesion DNA synthesis-associated protein ImuA [Steroidobacteraceae bacterium]